MRTITEAAIASQNTNALKTGQTTAEKGIWGYLAQYKSARTALWIAPRTDWAYRKLAAVDPIGGRGTTNPDQAQLLDLAGGSRFMSGSTNCCSVQFLNAATFGLLSVWRAVRRVSADWGCNHALDVVEFCEPVEGYPPRK